MSILTSAITWVTQLIINSSYVGIFIGMTIESSSIPLPSEIIMGISGYLVYQGKMNLILVALVGALGNLAGSTIMYLIGLKGGRPVINKYGKYFHISEEKFNKVEGWFRKWGDKLTFFAQLIPVVRTFVSLPLGILKISYAKFAFFTFTGAFVWCIILAYIASLLGSEWGKISEYIHQFEGALIILLIALVIVYVGWRIYKKSLNKRSS